jgi:hypothetical protein
VSRRCDAATVIRRITARAAVASFLAALTLAACSQAEPEPSGWPDNGASPLGPSSAAVSPELAGELALARAATARYVTDLDAAEAAGYSIITTMMPGMGYHYLNANNKGFDVTQPAILVYLNNGDHWQLGALEWIWPEQPPSAPLEGATYGSFEAGCHYQDGTYVPAVAGPDCAQASPAGSPLRFWHPKLVTLHVWLWYHNPAGLYHPTNPLVAAAPTALPTPRRTGSR